MTLGQITRDAINLYREYKDKGYSHDEVIHTVVGEILDGCSAYAPDQGIFPQVLVEERIVAEGKRIAEDLLRATTPVLSRQEHEQRLALVRDRAMKYLADFA